MAERKKVGTTSAADEVTMTDSDAPRERKKPLTVEERVWCLEQSLTEWGRDFEAFKKRIEQELVSSNTYWKAQIDSLTDQLSRFAQRWRDQFGGR